MTEKDPPHYLGIAPFYDWIMSHVDYDHWGEYLMDLAVEYGSPPKRILELGAGTCPFRRRKIFPEASQVVYSDLSLPMLREAGKNSNGHGDRVAADAMHLPFKSGFDLCLMIYDSLNYLLYPEEIAACFREVSRILRPGGLFLFDITTELNSLTYFQESVGYEESSDCTYVRESWYDEEIRIQYNSFLLFARRPDGLYEKHEESHAQRIYEKQELIDLAVAGGFSVPDVLGDFGREPANDTSERMHFILKKA